MMHVHLVPAAPTAEPQVLDLLKQAAIRLQRKGLSQWQNWLEPSPSDLEWIKEGFAAKEFYFIQNTDNEILGAIRILTEDLLYWGEQAEQALYIHSLTVLGKYAGQGIGQGIIDQVADQAAQSGCKWLRLDCNAGNSALCDYYEKQGFKQVGVRVFDDFSCNLYQRKV